MKFGAISMTEHGNDVFSFHVDVGGRELLLTEQELRCLQNDAVSALTEINRVRNRPSDEEIADKVKEYLRRGMKINAIKYLRQYNPGMQLMEAKTKVEEMLVVDEILHAEYKRACDVIYNVHYRNEGENA